MSPNRGLTGAGESGEKEKRIATVSALHDQLIGEGISPNDLVVACGGGVTSDIVGFAAATLFRGVRWGICATTLLSMADASIGGKTGINHSRGKNLIGAYWQPSFVLDDLEWLDTLPEREFRSGGAEIIKSAGLVGGRLLQSVASWANSSFDRSYPGLSSILEATVAFKSEIVGTDERDTGVRTFLNFGHTVGHAIERSLNYKRLAHGEAIILGMLAALELSSKLGIARSRKMRGFEEILHKALSQIPRVKLSPERIVEAMRFDKKRSGGNPRFVLLVETGHPVVREVPQPMVKLALKEMINLNEKR